MLQQTLMFLAEGSPSERTATRMPSKKAAAVSPPAGRLPGRIRLALNVAGNAAGFATLLAMLWYTLWLAQALLIPGAH